MKITKKETIKYLVAILTFALFSNGCSCPSPDYSKEIKNILDPVARTLENFYITHQRMPYTRERNKMLEDRGCLFDEEIERFCKKDGVEFKVWNDSVQGSSSDYVLNMTYGDVSCGVEISSDGKKEDDYATCREYCGGGWKG